MSNPSASASAGKPGSLPCPHCGAKGHHPVTDSRDSAEKRRRRRTCYACHERFSTTERIVGDGEFWRVMESIGIRGHLRNVAGKIVKVV